MTSAEDVEHGVLPDSRTYSRESIRESKLESGSQAAPAKSLQLEQREDNSPSPRALHGWKWVAASVSLYIGALIYSHDSTIAADIQSAIVEQFDNVERLTWIGTAFPYGSVCAILPA